MKCEVTKGFTLIELLVVVLIIGILAAVALPQYQKAVMRARAAEAILNLKRINQAQKVYYETHGYSTDDLSLLDVIIPTGFYSYGCNRMPTVPGGDCYAFPQNSSAPVFERFADNTLFCRGTEKQCALFSTQYAGMGSLYGGYWRM